MTHKKLFLKDIEMNKQFKTSLMVMKRIHKDSNMTTYILTDRSEQIKARIPNKFKLKPGQVIEIDSKKGYVIIFKCKKCGAIRKNKAAEDDNMDLIIKLSARHDF